VPGAASGLGLVRALAAGLRAGEIDADVAEAAAASLDAYVEREAASLDDAFGLVRARGERDARNRAALSERDQLLRQAAAQFYPRATPAEAGRLLASKMEWYLTSAWARERGASACPPRHAGRVEECLWKALKAEPRALSSERIEKVLRTAQIGPV
jgi:hypothetical protein